MAIDKSALIQSVMILRESNMQAYENVTRSLELLASQVTLEMVKASGTEDLLRSQGKTIATHELAYLFRNVVKEFEKLAPKRSSP